MNGIKGSKNISIVHNQDTEFEYFTMESCKCDGTLLFMSELIGNIFYKLLQCGTYNLQTCPKDIETNFWNYDVKYTVGNFILNEEYGDFGTDEKPWMRSRFTAMLPIKCEFKKQQR